LLTLANERLNKNSIERWLNQIRQRLRSPQFIVSILLLIVLAYLVLVPLYSLVERTLIWDESDTRMSREIEPGEMTLFHWKNVLAGRVAKPFFYKPLLNTLFTGSVAAGFALLIGGILSWFVTRTDLPGRGWLKTLLTLPYIIPSFAIALAWETLFRNPNIGGQPGFFQIVFNIPPPQWLSYGPVPMIITMVIHFFPFALLLVSGALETIDTQLEEGAEAVAHPPADLPRAGEGGAGSERRPRPEPQRDLEGRGFLASRREDRGARSAAHLGHP